MMKSPFVLQLFAFIKYLILFALLKIYQEIENTLNRIPTILLLLL